MDEPNLIKRISTASSVLLGIVVFGVLVPFWAAVDLWGKSIGKHGVWWFGALAFVLVVLLGWIDRLIDSRAVVQGERDTMKEQLATAKSTTDEVTDARKAAERERDTAKDQLATATAELATARHSIDQLTEARNAAQRERDTAKDQLATVTAELATARHSLEAPSERDVKLFQQFESDFPATGDGVVRYLRNNFFGKQWTVQSLATLDDLQETWRYGRTFDDPQVEAARVHFWERLDEFTTLLGAEGDVTDDSPAVARLIESRNRPGGQEEWEAARTRVRGGASALVTAHEELIGVARKRRL